MVKRGLLSIVALMLLAGSAFGAITLYSDSFEGYELGAAPPAPWNAWYSTGTTVENTFAKTGTQSVWIAGGSVGQDVVPFHKSGKVKFAFRGNSYLQFFLYISNGVNETYTRLLVTYWSGILYSKPTGGYGPALVPSAGVELDVWHDLEVIFDTDLKTQDVFLDGVLIGDNIPMFSTNLGNPDTMLRVYINDLSGWADGENLSFIDDLSLQVLGDPNDPSAKHLKSDLYADWKVDFKDFALMGEQWMTTVSTSDPLAFGKAATPGYYVASVKSVDQSDVHSSKLCMYTFNADGTMTNKYWDWVFPMGSSAAALSDRVIGDAIGTVTEPSFNADEARKVVGLAKHLAGESAMTTLTGTYTTDGRKININYSNGSWEKWYVTWEEPGNLYKMEMYDASYKKAGTVCWLKEQAGTFIRDTSAHTAGWAFGNKKRNFAYAAPESQFLKSLRGASLGYGVMGTPVDTLREDDQANFASVGAFTTNNVIRYCYEDTGYTPAPWVYAYFTKPASNPGNMARRTMYQSSHDFDNNGTIEDNSGHCMAGLQIVDAAGKYRGSVLNQVDSASWVQALYWLDTIEDNDSRIGIKTEINCKDVRYGQYGNNADFNGDCSVNMQDLKSWCSFWLQCNNPADWNCTAFD